MNLKGVSMKRFTLIWAILFICMSLVSAQEDAWYLGKEIVDIDFVNSLENQRLYSPLDELQDLVEPYRGQPFSNELYWQLEEVLFATGYFEDIVAEAIDENGDESELVIRFIITEKPVITEVQINGNSGVRRLDILDVILLKQNSIAVLKRLREDVKSIEQLYIDKGFADINVSGRFSEVNDKGEVSVIFTINEGSQIRVKAILFEGIQFASEGTLRGVLKSKVQTVLFNPGVFKESNLSLDREELLLYYRKNGFIDAEVLDISRETSVAEDGRTEMVLTYFIKEGEQYTFGGMEFEGNQLYSDEELQNLVSHQKGKILDLPRVENDFLAVTDLYLNNGYLWNQFDRSEKRDEALKQITFVISISEFGQAIVENVLVEGNTKSKNEILYREIPIQSGDIFSKEKLIDGLRNLLNLGYFSKVEPVPSQGSKEGYVNITYVVEENQTTNINFSFSFAGSDAAFPIVGLVNFEDTNFRGNGQKLSAGTQVSSEAQSLNFGFTENWIAGRRWSGGVNLSLEHSSKTGVLQDILGPVFADDDPNKVPDPFDGHYVDSETGETITDLSNIDALIASGDAITDYEYALRNGLTIDPSFTMNYESYDISLSLNTGYTFITDIGKFIAGTGVQTGFGYIIYDETLYRPYDEEIRDNLETWQPVTRVWLNTAWDLRDFVFNPTQGIYLSNSFTYVGGIFPSTRNYLKNTTRAQAFYPLFSLPVASNWDFEMIFAFNTSFAMILPNWNPYTGELTTNITIDEMLRTDGMNIARGWDPNTGNEALWDSWIELRTPLIRELLWFDWFLSGTVPFKSRDDISSLSWEDPLFSFGGNLRLTVPGLPIGLYLAKRFKVEEGAIEWQTGNYFNADNTPGAGLDFGITFSFSPF
jgi:outer membrane protein insertion porin family